MRGIMTAWMLALLTSVGPVLLLGGEGGPAPRLSLDVFIQPDHPDVTALRAVSKELRKVHADLPIREHDLATPDGQAAWAKWAGFWDKSSAAPVRITLGPYLISTEETGGRPSAYLAHWAEHILRPGAFKERLEADVEGFAREQFGPTCRVVGTEIPVREGVPNTPDVVYGVADGMQIVGWVVAGYRPLGCPVCASADFLAALDPRANRLLALKPVRQLEYLGSAMAQEQAEAFLKQFPALDLADPALLKGEIDVISGATQTSIAYLDAILAGRLKIQALTEKNFDENEEIEDLPKSPRKE
jgi:hypothetical protein